MRPVLIWCTSRSRSSLVAERFSEKGLWIGNANAKSCGYRTYENQDIKALAKRYRQECWKTDLAEPVSHCDEFIKELMEIVTNNQQWMMKMGAEYYPAFQALNPYNIFVFRNIDDCVKSVCDKNGSRDYAFAREIIQKRFDYMLTMCNLNGGVCVNTDDLVAGNDRDLNKALKYCGLS